MQVLLWDPNSNSGYAHFSPMTNDYRCLLQRFHRQQLDMFREANKCADLLARMGRDSTARAGFCNFYQPPDVIINYLLLMFLTELQTVVFQGKKNIEITFILYYYIIGTINVRWS